MILTTWDFILLCFQLPLSIILTHWFSKSVLPELQAHFKRGLILKFSACIVLGLVYQYYYSGGDTLNYFKNSRYLTSQIISHPQQFFTYVFSSEEQFKNLFENYINQLDESTYYFNTANITMVKIAAVFNLLTFNSFFGTGFIFCFFSYLGLWRIFLVFYKAYPNIGMQFTYMLYIPSVVFWSSGILKDGFCMGCLGLIIYHVEALKLNDKKILLRILFILISFYLIWLIKSYIVLCLILPLLFWKYSFNFIKLKEKISAKKLLFLNIILIYFIYRFGKIKQRIQSISLEELYTLIIKTRAGFISSSDTDASSFSLGEFSATISGFLLQMPKAVNAVLFRPYIWETKKIFSLVAATESLLFLICTIWVIKKVGLKLSLKCFISNPDILFCFFFTILFAAALGLSVSNFGALVRFKIQFMPFFVIGLLLIYHKKNKRDELPSV
jgi:hypothetical protein